MGRGRAKAKQTKVARELKYSSPSTDLTALQRELAGADPAPVARAPRDGDDDVDGTGDDFDDERWASSR